MRILVFGGAGFIGRHLCGELAERGHDVVAISRSPPEDVLPTGVETAAADVTDYASLEPICVNGDAIVNLVAKTPLYQPSGGESQHQAIHLQGTRNLVRAAGEAGIARFVQMSGHGASPDATTAYLQAKGRAEGVVQSSDLDWVIIRPTVVFGDESEFISFIGRLTTPYLTALPGGGHTPFQLLWVGDLAPMLADAVEDDEHVHQRYDLAGPTVYTLAEATRLYYEGKGQSVRILPIPMPLVRVGLTLASPIPFIPFGVHQYRGLQLENVVETNDVSAFGYDAAALMSLEAYLIGDNTKDVS